MKIEKKAKGKGKGKAILGIAMAVMLLVSALAVASATATDKVITDDVPAFSAFDHKTNASTIFADEHEKEVQAVHEKRLEKIEQMPRTPGTLYVTVWEDYWYDFGADELIKEHVSDLEINLELYNVKADEVTVNLQLPVGIKPEYAGGFIPSKIYFDEKTGDFSVTFDTSENTYIGTYFNLPGLDLNPFSVVPVPSVSPSYCAINESKEVTVKLSSAILKEEYDYARAYLKVSDVKTISITETTPEANNTDVYTDTHPYYGDYGSYAYARWHRYDFESLPEHTMKVYLQNDIDEVDTWYEYLMKKYSGTNVKLLNVTTSPAVTTFTDFYTYIDCDSTICLDPANYTVPHGVLKGTARNETGEILRGAEVRITGAPTLQYADVRNENYNYKQPPPPIPTPTPRPPVSPTLYIYKITDENGNYSVMLPPGNYSVYADYGFKAYGDEYETIDYYNVTVEDGVNTTQDLTFYRVPTVKMSITPVDDVMTEEDNKISYDVTIENTHTKTENISLYAYDDTHSNSGWIDDALDWTFSEDYFNLDPGENKTIRTEAEYVRKEDLQEERYAVEFRCNLRSDDFGGHYYLYDFFDFKEIQKLSVSVSTDKIDYQPRDIMETTITMTNTFNTSKTVTLYWWLTIPQFDYMTIMLSQPFILPPDYNNSLIIPVSIGEWGDSAFGAVWSVGFFDNENKIVAWDMTGWNYVPGAVSESKTTEEIAKEIIKEIEGVEL
jgi:hypothetical protein